MAWADAGARRLLLGRAVELDIVPRLVLPVHGLPERRPLAMPPPDLLSATSVEAFAELVLGRDFPEAFAYAEAARRGGLTLQALYLELLAPAARHLGELWNEDLCDFTQVTIGLGRLHRVLRELTPAMPSRAQSPAAQCALLVPAPGEQHTFGLAMVTEFFRQAAWTVWSGVPAVGGELAIIVRDNWFGVVGFSVGSHTRLDALRAGIAAVRRASRNKAVGIMVGGPIFIENPDLVAEVGADATAADGRQAVMRARGLLAPSPATV